MFAIYHATPLELIVALTLLLLVVAIGMLAQIGWEWLYTHVIYKHTKEYKEAQERLNKFRKTVGYEPKYTENNDKINCQQ